jgi:hypothetical protein
MTGAVWNVSPVEGESGGFSHPTDDDQERDDKCANLLQATSQRPIHKPN